MNPEIRRIIASMTRDERRRFRAVGGTIPGNSAAKKPQWHKARTGVGEMVRVRRAEEQRRRNQQKKRDRLAEKRRKLMRKNAA